MRLYNEIKAEFKYEITVADIFRRPTVKLLAEFLDRAPAETTSSPPIGENAVLAMIRDPEQIDRISANLDHLSEEEVDLLLAELEDKESECHG